MRTGWYCYEFESTRTLGFSGGFAGSESSTWDSMNGSRGWEGWISFSAGTEGIWNMSMGWVSRLSVKLPEPAREYRWPKAHNPCFWNTHDFGFQPQSLASVGYFRVNLISPPAFGYPRWGLRLGDLPVTLILFGLRLRKLRGSRPQRRIGWEHGNMN